MDKECLLFLERIEEYLLKSNIHTDIIPEFMNALAKKAISTKCSKQEIIATLRNNIAYAMSKFVKSFDVDSKNKPYVMLVCGINGSGKTTTIGKMVNLLLSYGWDILVAGCDTFRAGATQQLEGWLKDYDNIFVKAEKENDTPTKVAVRAYKEAVDKDKDVLIIDTSGRVHKDQNLMAELLKMKQKLKEFSSFVPNDTVLVVDSTSGYNAIEQAKMYNDLIGITGIIATKVDISKRPGIILSICKKLNIPVYGVGDGEEKDKINDLDCNAFADAILCDINEIM